MIKSQALSGPPAERRRGTGGVRRQPDELAVASGPAGLVRSTLCVSEAIAIPYAAEAVAGLPLWSQGPVGHPAHRAGGGNPPAAGGIATRDSAALRMGEPTRSGPRSRGRPRAGAAIARAHGRSSHYSLGANESLGSECRAAVAPLHLCHPTEGGACGKSTSVLTSTGSRSPRAVEVVAMP